MTAIQAISESLIMDDRQLSKHESMLLEADIFTRICEELKEIIKRENRDYFLLLKIDNEKGRCMIEADFIRCIIKDILSSEEYTLSGIACYTDTPEDIIYDVAIGSNTTPSLYLSQKIINLHRAVRPKLYSSIVDKIRSDNVTE